MKFFNDRILFVPHKERWILRILMWITLAGFAVAYPFILLAPTHEIMVIMFFGGNGVLLGGLTAHQFYYIRCKRKWGND